MNLINDASKRLPQFRADRALWRRGCATEVDDDAAVRFLDLAGLADGRLDDEEHDRVAARVAADPLLASDVAAARALASGGIAMAGGIERIIARAAALADAMPQTASAAAPRTPLPRRQILHGAAQWASLAAALALASWLGFSMGSNTWLTWSQPQLTNQTGDANFLPEVLDPSAGFLGDLGAGRQT